MAITHRTLFVSVGLFIIVLILASLTSEWVHIRTLSMTQNKFNSIEHEESIVPVLETETNSQFPEWKTAVLRDFAMVIISSDSFHHRIQWALKTWWEPDFDPIVEVLSDSLSNRIESIEKAPMRIPNVYNTTCPSSYNYGLWCKNLWMLERWKKDPKFANTKWFYRGMDDSWVHMENMLWLTRQYDHTKPIVIGEKLCSSKGSYPDGGPGFLISRGVIDHWNAVNGWKEALEINKPATVYDDVIWGIYIKRNNITLIHYPGISHHTMNPGSELWAYYKHQLGHPWPLAFRPVLYHQTKKWLHLMPEMQRVFHELDYGRIIENPYMPPFCGCPKDNPHRRCGWNFFAGMCHWSTGWLYCLGPGPWPNSDNVAEGSLVHMNPPDGMTISTHFDQVQSSIYYMQQAIARHDFHIAQLYLSSEYASDVAPRWNRLLDTIANTKKSFEDPQEDISNAVFEKTSSLRTFFKAVSLKDESFRNNVIKVCVIHSISPELLRKGSTRQRIYDYFKDPASKILWPDRETFLTLIPVLEGLAQRGKIEPLRPALPEDVMSPVLRNATNAI